jgi:hypothetical protein
MRERKLPRVVPNRIPLPLSRFELVQAAEDGEFISPER